MKTKKINYKKFTKIDKELVNISEKRIKQIMKRFLRDSAKKEIISIEKSKKVLK